MHDMISDSIFSYFRSRPPGGIICSDENRRHRRVGSPASAIYTLRIATADDRRHTDEIQSIQTRSTSTLRRGHYESLTCRLGIIDEILP